MLSLRLIQRCLFGLAVGVTCITSQPNSSALAFSGTGVPVVIHPSDANGNELAGPGYFEVTATPGSVVHLYALVGNKSSNRTAVSIVPVDGATGVYGGVTARLGSQPRRAVGAWLHVTERTIRLAPNKGQIVPFTLSVPKRTRPGQYVGALTAFVPSPETRHGRGFTLTVQTRLADDVVVTVPGPQHRTMQITGLNSQRRTIGTYLIAQIKNSGTMMLKGWGYLWVWQSGHARPILARPLRIDTTLPHTMVHYPIRLGVHPRPGRYSYKLKLWWNGGRTTKHGPISIRQ